MAAGPRDRRLTFLRKNVGARDALGTRTPVWGELATIWGAKAEISDGERVAAAGVGRQVTHRFTTLSSDALRAVTRDDRLRSDEGVFDIVAIKEIGRRARIEWTACLRPAGDA